MTSWDGRVDAVWSDPLLSDDQRIVEIDRLAGEYPQGDARALLERAGARDAAGREHAAEPLYRAALAAGLDEEHRSQAIIQLASTLRNLGRLGEALALLEAESARGGALGDAVSAFYALTLVSAGEPPAALRWRWRHWPRTCRGINARCRRTRRNSTWEAPDMPTANTADRVSCRR